MTKEELLQQIEAIGLIPVVRAASAADAITVAEVIAANGVPIFEITMTVPGAVNVIEQLCRRFGDEVLIGAGTVLDPEAAGACVAAGARFIVSPSLNLETIKFCNAREIPIFPGALTPTEVVTAWQAGADAVKVFPASAVGGPSYLRALKAPLPQIKLVPTGGVSLSTARDFIAAGAWALGVGSDLVNTKAIQADYTEVVAAAARDYVAAVREARSHAGL